MIKLENVSKTIKDNEVLTNITHSFDAGRVYLVTGHNGCGKTMLLRMLCELIRPTTGTVTYSKNLEFGVIIETPQFMENETGWENLKFLASIKKKIKNDTILNTLRMLELEKVKDKKVKTYSLGMKQRLAIAQAIMEDPDVLLLDEPFNAIDEQNLNVVIEKLHEQKRAGKMIVIATHQFPPSLASIVDEHIEMDNGRVKNFQTVS